MPFTKVCVWQQVLSALQDSFKNPNWFNTAMVWMVSVIPLIFSSLGLFSRFFGTVPRAPSMIGITVTFMFHNFFCSQARSRSLLIFLLSFLFTVVCREIVTSNRINVYKLVALHRNTWNHMNMYKLFVLRIVTWRYNCLQRIIIIISYLKSYNYLQKKKKKKEKNWVWHVKVTKINFLLLIPCNPL